MTLTDIGINYCLKSFGDTNWCSVSLAYGLTFSYVDTNGVAYTNIAGGTGSILNFLALGIVQTLTMDQFPERGTFTKALVETENGAPISFGDGDILALHDELSGDQWCFIPCSAHTTQVTCEIYQCFWWNGACHDLAPTCDELNNEPECLEHNCYWYNGSCHTSLPTCEVLNNEPDCLEYGCFWYNGACHSTVVCENILIQTECTAHGCYWYDGACHSAVTCASILIQTECEAHNCFWWNGACHDAAPTCTVLNNDPDCLRFGCFWYRGPTYPTYTCNDADQPGLCHWADATAAGPYGITSLDIFVLVTSYTTATNVPGYTFTPTSLQIFGIVLYYQDNMSAGNVYTGCAYP